MKKLPPVNEVHPDSAIRLSQQPLTDRHLELMLAHDIPELISTNIPAAEIIVRRHQRQRRLVYRGGLVSVCLCGLATAWLMMAPTQQPQLANQALGPNPGPLPSHVVQANQLDRNSQPTLVAEDNSEGHAAQWKLELGEVADNGTVTLMLTSNSEQSPESMVIGFVTPPRAMEVPMWQLPPVEQEMVHYAFQNAELVVPIEL